MIDVTTFDQAAETETPPVFTMELLLTPWPGWFSPDDDLDGGHSDR